MFRTIRRYLREMPNVLRLDDAAKAAAAAETLDDQVQHLVTAIRRSLTLAAVATDDKMRATNLGIARLNFASLRALTSEFTRSVTPEVESVRAELESLTNPKAPS